MRPPPRKLNQAIPSVVLAELASKGQVSVSAEIADDVRRTVDGIWKATDQSTGASADASGIEETASVGDKRDPEQTPKLDDESNRGKTSKDGFGDYDKNPSSRCRDRHATQMVARKRHRGPKSQKNEWNAPIGWRYIFTYMIIRNRGAAMDGQITSW